MRTACLLCVLSLLALSARAQDAGSAYFGLSYGNLHYKNVNDLNGIEVHGIGAFSRTGNQARLIGGYKINDRFGVEAGWANTRDIDDYRSTVYDAFPEPTIENSTVDAEIETLTVRAVGIVPFRHLSLFGAVGYYSASLDGTYLTSGQGYDDWYGGHYEYSSGPYSLDTWPGEFDHLSHSGATLAGGIQVDFDAGPSVRAEVEYFFTSQDVTLYAFSVGVLYRLGRRRLGRD